MKPHVRRTPDKLILHGGSSDLRKLQPRIIADNIVNLVTQIKGDSPCTIVGVSPLLVRNDNNDLATKGPITWKISARPENECQSGNR